MIEKIKSMMRASEDISNVREEMIKVKKELAEYTEEAKKRGDQVLKTIMEHEEKLGKMLSSNEDALDKLHDIGDNFQKELNEFKIVKTKIRTEVVEQVASTIHNELSIYIQNVKSNVEKLNEAAKEIKNTSDNSRQIMATMNDLREIAKSIRKEDFELTKYADTLRKSDSEKLELLRKIDNLERLISKQRQARR